MSAHTPLPWHHYGPIIHAQGQHIAHMVVSNVGGGEQGTPVERANTELVIRSVNTHGELWGVLNAIRVRVRMAPLKQDRALLDLLPRMEDVLARAQAAANPSLPTGKQSSAVVNTPQ